MSQRARVLLLIPHLGGGGAERVTELLARHLSKEKYDVHLGVLSDSSPSEPSPSEIPAHFLEAARVRTSAFRLLALIWRLKPDLILCNMAHLNFLVLLLRPFMPTGIRLLIRQNGTASSMLRSAKRTRSTKLLYRFLYRRADQVICQSEAMAEDLASIARLQRGKLVVLRNPVDVEAMRRSHGNGSGCPDTGGPHLLAAGRLSPEKGFDLLLDAFSRLQHTFAGADLIIAGAGRQEGSLKEQCRALGINHSVSFAGHVKEPAALFSSATLFVVSSRHEGIPNALLEAAAAGLPIVATPASVGMVDLLKARPGVWLAHQVTSAALAEALSEAVHSLRPRQHFSHAWIEPFRLGHSIAAYESLIDRCLSAGRK